MPTRPAATTARYSDDGGSSVLSNPKSRPIRLPADAAAAQAAAPSLPGTPAQLEPLPLAQGTDGGAPAGPARGTYAGAAVSNGQVAALIETFFPSSQWAAANAVSRCESGQRNVISPPNADGTRDYGIFQLNSGGTLQGLLARFSYPVGDLNVALEPTFNVQAAAALWRVRGWEPWTCARKLGYVTP